jgi:SAM-dependent methyltransferase
MFYYNRKDGRVLFMDKRKESHLLTDKYSDGGKRPLVIDPDLQADFTDLPFPDATFSLVIFDPPHLLKVGNTSWLAKKYGKLKGDWREEIKQGFLECFRVLKADGTLIFKWNEIDIPTAQILALTPIQPLLGSRGGKASKTHWIVFTKIDSEMSDPIFN